MRKIISDILWGRNSKINGIMALGIFVLIVLGCNCKRTFDLGNQSSDNDPERPSSNRMTDPETPENDGSLPSDRAIKSLVRDTTGDFKDAIDTGDFSELYNNASTDFQSSYTEDQMKNAFSSFTREKKRVVPILERALGMEPDFSPAPYLRTERNIPVLVVNGRYATKPIPVNVEYEYVYRGGEWKLLKLIVKITK